MDNLLNNDESRCNDRRCPTKCYCARYKQRLIDCENGKKDAPIANFKGSYNRCLCRHFLNADVIQQEKRSSYKNK